MYLQVSLENSYLDEEGVKVGEDVPLDREDWGEVGEEKDSRCSGQEGQHAGEQ